MGKKTGVKKEDVKKKEYTVKYRSHKDKSKWYKIKVTDDEITCTCADYVYRKQKKKMFCKHIFKALK